MSKRGRGKQLLSRIGFDVIFYGWLLASLDSNSSCSWTSSQLFEAQHMQRNRFRLFIVKTFFLTNIACLLRVCYLSDISEEQTFKFMTFQHRLHACYAQRYIVWIFTCRNYFFCLEHRLYSSYFHRYKITCGSKFNSKSTFSYLKYKKKQSMTLQIAISCLNNYCKRQIHGLTCASKREFGFFVICKSEF